MSSLSPVGSHLRLSKSFNSLSLLSLSSSPLPYSLLHASLPAQAESTNKARPPVSHHITYGAAPLFRIIHCHPPTQHLSRFLTSFPTSHPSYLYLAEPHQLTSQVSGSQSSQSVSQSVGISVYLSACLVPTLICAPVASPCSWHHRHPSSPPSTKIPRWAAGWITRTRTKGAATLDRDSSAFQ